LRRDVAPTTPTIVNDPQARPAVLSERGGSVAPFAFSYTTSPPDARHMPPGGAHGSSLRSSAHDVDKNAHPHEPRSHSARASTDDAALLGHAVMQEPHPPSPTDPPFIAPSYALHPSVDGHRPIHSTAPHGPFPLPHAATPRSNAYAAPPQAPHRADHQPSSDAITRRQDGAGQAALPPLRDQSQPGPTPSRPAQKTSHVRHAGKELARREAKPSTRNSVRADNAQTLPSQPHHRRKSRPAASSTTTTTTTTDDFSTAFGSSMFSTSTESGDLYNSTG